MLPLLGEYAATVWRYWWALIPGLLLTAISLVAYLPWLRDHEEWIVTRFRRWFLVLGIAGLLLAQFLAWKDMRAERDTALAEGGERAERLLDAPGEPGNRLVQVVKGPFHAGGHGLSVEFGANRIAIPPGFGVGVRLSGGKYAEAECVFHSPDLWWGWDAGATPCEAVFVERGEMDRYEIRPLNQAISPRTSLYLWFKSEEELKLIDCYFQATYGDEKTPCDSPLIEFRD